MRPQGLARRVLLPACDAGLRIFCVNLQVPGAKPYSIIFYFACASEIDPDSVLGRFWHGSDAYRAPRFKLIPSITEGAWAVQRSVGTKPLIVGNALRTSYYGGGTERYVGDSKLHEMVEIAMQEDWEVCVAHMELIGQIIGEVIAQGVASGEFEVEDLEVAALCACTAMMRFFHPQMIAQCATKPGPTIDQMIDFVVAGLSPRARAH
jgi:hypothetical protein